MPAAFYALRHRAFRALWLASLVSSLGTWMQILAQSLLVLQLTRGSALALGAVSLSQAAAFLLFALAGGGIADRFDKRRLLLVTQTLALTLALLLAAITASGAIRFWMIAALAFCSGAVLSVDQPARTSFLPLLVPRQEMPNAIALQSTIFGAASIAGPALAGILVAAVGYAGTFLLNAASYLAVIAALLTVSPPDSSRREAPVPLRESVRGALREVRRDEVLPWILAGYAALLFLGPSPALLLPVFGTQILHTDPRQVGVLFTAAGIGSVAGSLVVASWAGQRRRERLFGRVLMVWAAALACFGKSGSLWTALIFLVLLGAAQAAASAISIFLLQSRVPVEMRGRTMSLNTLLHMGVRPLGDFPIGALISLAGVPAATAASALLVFLAAIGLASRFGIGSSGASQPR